ELQDRYAVLDFRAAVRKLSLELEWCGRLWRRISGHRYGTASGDREESVPTRVSNGRLLRSGYAVRCRRLHHGSSRPHAAVPQEHLVHAVRVGTHGVSRFAVACEDEAGLRELY